ncbi:hypothetical protein Sme01_74760 [Sphaerisporangium melleum]|uniref:Uncharacterized protein n=1 Tax=Sphaerisporangium melleum TaxID=321316 RepID=A0A917VV15_9ACTN|nr:hypothetical protein GCM10007964_75150 [Sphaerisporangium melleum]GII75000.1 hypothetical protein Sme01_74760 [Sphaerisporangium melleum]
MGPLHPTLPALTRDHLGVITSRHHDQMTRWIRYLNTEDDTWTHIELDDQQWATRQVDLHGPDQ